MNNQPENSRASGDSNDANAPYGACQPQPGNQAYWQQSSYAPSYTAPVQPQKKSRGWIVALVAVVLLFAFLFAALASCTSVMAGASSSMFGAGSQSAVDSLSEDAVGVITIDGTIDYDGSTASPEGLKAQLDRAENNPHIKAVVLRVNSGGGTATAGEEMASYVNDFSKPVVVSSASVNASAAYEISSQADYIFSAKTTAIGAIGTAMQVTDLSGLLDKLGISVENITSAESKDSSYGTRPLTEEERAYYQAMVDTVNETFMETVASGRSLPIERVRELATGLTYTGIDAIQNGLADEIGTREDAIAKAAELAGMRTYAVVSLEPESDDLSDLVGLLSSSKMSNEDLIERLKELNGNGSQH